MYQFITFQNLWLLVEFPAKYDWKPDLFHEYRKFSQKGGRQGAGLQFKMVIEVWIQYSMAFNGYFVADLQQKPFSTEVFGQLCEAIL